MADLRLDTDEMLSTVEQLARVQRKLDNTMRMSVDSATHVGHGLLGASIIYFANKWNAKRDDMDEAVNAIKGSVEKIAEEFDKVDASLAAGFEE